VHVKNIAVHAPNIAVLPNIIAAHARFPYAHVRQIAVLPNNIAASAWKTVALVDNIAALPNNIAVHVRLPYARAWKIAGLVKNIGVHARNIGVHVVLIEERRSQRGSNSAAGEMPLYFRHTGHPMGRSASAAAAMNGQERPWPQKKPHCWGFKSYAGD
jgi:hypothetical protein